MIACTECYIQENGKTLMLYRNRKKNDINAGKWIGLGGKLEDGESPEHCLVREVSEEAGVRLTNYRLHGTVTFTTANPEDDSYLIFIYTASAYEGEVKLSDCTEGELRWIEDDKLLELGLWEGDKLFWNWIFEDRPFFSAWLLYDGDKLSKHEVRFYY